MQELFFSSHRPLVLEKKHIFCARTSVRFEPPILMCETENRNATHIANTEFVDYSPINTIASYSLAKATISSRGVMSPSIEKDPSVATTRIPNQKQRQSESSKPMRRCFPPSIKFQTNANGEHLQTSIHKNQSRVVQCSW